MPGICKKATLAGLSKYSTRLTCALSLSVVFVFGSAPTFALPYTDLYIFGDSLSDTGNVKRIVDDSIGSGPFSGITKTIAGNLAGYGSNGRFSNGPVWHEYMAGLLGLSAATNSLDGGTNYAYGGAVVDNAGPPSAGILTQNSQYLAGPGSDGSDPSALYVAWIGGNDVRGVAGDPVAEQLAAINASINALEGMLSGLIDNGVSSLLVPNLPDIGSIPEFAGGADSASATAATLAWNSALKAMLTPLAQTTATDIFYLDVFTIFGDILATPTDFGFINTSDQCRSVGDLALVENECENSETFVFWDQIHPTTAAHQELGQRAFALLESGQVLGRVPAPTTAWLLALGLLGLLLSASPSRKPSHRVSLAG
jgi:phospholipase/lecithinase/hemolysin